MPCLFLTRVVYCQRIGQDVFCHSDLLRASAPLAVKNADLRSPPAFAWRPHESPREARSKTYHSGPDYALPPRSLPEGVARQNARLCSSIDVRLRWPGQARHDRFFTDGLG